MDTTPLDSLPQNEWDKLIVSILKPYYSFCRNDTLITPQDLKQEAWIGLLSACKNYDARKAKFVTFAYYYIRGHVMRYVAKRTQNKPSIMNIADNADAYDVECETSQCDREDIDRRDLSDTIFAKVADQPHAELLIEHFVYDQSFRAMGKKHGVSHEAIKTRIHKLLDLLQIRLQNENA